VFGLGSVVTGALPLAVATTAQTPLHNAHGPFLQSLLAITSTAPRALQFMAACGLGVIFATPPIPRARTLAVRTLLNNALLWSTRYRLRQVPHVPTTTATIALALKGVCGLVTFATTPLLHAIPLDAPTLPTIAVVARATINVGMVPDVPTAVASAALVTLLATTTTTVCRASRTRTACGTPTLSLIASPKNNVTSLTAVSL